MVSPSNSYSSDSLIKGIYRKFLRLIGFFTEYHELKLFWVCFHGIDFKPAQKFTSIMFQFLKYCFQICSTRVQSIIIRKIIDIRLFYDKE